MSKERRDVVLVVDDSADSLSMINDTLENAGMDVLVALEGKQALTIAQRIRPDLILMDALMPQMDGFEACRLLKANPALASIPVIFMTGLTDTEDIVRGLEVGGVDYLIKPVKPNELIARMKVHLANARLTHSAYSALDHAGQHLLTANALGQVLWATPQTYDLLAKANATEDWQNQILSQQLRTWMSQEPDSNSQLSLRGLGYPLFIRLVGSEPNGHRLFRLIDGHKTMDAPLLKEQLNLTDREAEVLYWIANGKTNREVAEILAMSPRTVNKHLEQVFPKLGVENRTAAAGIALRVLSRNQ